MKSDRLDLRMTKRQKAIILRGAKKAKQTMAAFVLSAAIGNAEAILGYGSYLK